MSPNSGFFRSPHRPPGSPPGVQAPAAQGIAAWGPVAYAPSPTPPLRQPPSNPWGVRARRHPRPPPTSPFGRVTTIGGGSCTLHLRNPHSGNRRLRGGHVLARSTSTGRPLKIRGRAEHLHLCNQIRTAWTCSRSRVPWYVAYHFCKENHISASCPNYTSLDRRFRTHSLNGRCFRCGGNRLDRNCEQQEVAFWFCQRTDHHPAFCLT